MMPGPGRSPAPSLPPVDDEATAPFSDLFKHGFDPATIDATTQLADRSIFVTSSGRRYRFESIPDTAPLKARVPPSTSLPTSLDALPPPPFHSPPPDPPPQLHVYAPNSPPGWARPPPPASLHSYPFGAYTGRSGRAAAVATGPDPRSATHEVATMMANLTVNRFGASPLYGESDGGVQAAETLTDPDAGPKPLASNTNPGVSLPSPGATYVQQQQQHQQQQQQRPPPPSYSGPPGTPYSPVSPVAAPHYWTPVDYVSYTTQTNAHLQTSHQKAVATTGLPSLIEGAMPLSPPQRASDPNPLVLATSPDKEVWDGPAQTSGYYHSPLHPSMSAPPSFPGRHASYPGGGMGEIDTQTPVVVHHAPSTTSDVSTGRDNVLPGEDLLFDGPVKSAQSLSAPVFREGVLKVFRNTLTNDLRFYCKVDHESETFWMKASDAQLVPAYAYDQRLSNIVYIRDMQKDKGAGYMQASQGNCRPSGIYQFSSLKEMFDFQEKLTGERVVLDIGSVRMVTLSKANGRSSTRFSSARLQIWHEVEGRKNPPSDVASFVTAGTVLSGPLRDRLVPSSSRLMLYLGRSGEYITVFITDDLEIKADGQMVVKLKPRKGPIPFSKKGSRWPWVKAHLEKGRGSEPAGFDIHGKVVEVDIGSEYDSYKTFEIEFENSPSQDNFIRKWDEVIRERRLQRAKLAGIRDVMESAVFTGSQALNIQT